jgi:GntR family transcriptional regulator/MocR family aminotransferase
MDLLIKLARGSGSPSLHSQVEAQVRDAIRAGRLGPGVRLPSTRALAEELGVARGVVVESYAQLGAEGYLEIRRRGKTFVSAVAASGGAERATPSSGGGAIRYDFHPGVPDLGGFPRAAWARALRTAVRDVPGRELAYGDLRGAAVLREALAVHMGRARGAVASPDRIVVTQGFTQGLSLVCEALRRRGVRRIAVEEPCLPIHRAVAEAAGLTPIPVEVDEHGIRTEGLERLAVGGVLVTPAHQFPLGVVLAPHRRTELVEWARRAGAFIVDDDYDAEYRYDRGPVGSLQGLAPERVVYGGSVSKTLAPALRIGWLLLPDELLGPVIERKALAGQTPLLDQLALAELIEKGDFHRHLRRMRRRYRERRDATVEAVGEFLPEARPGGIAAGLHVVAHLPAGLDEARLVAVAYERGAGAHGLDLHRSRPDPSRPGLVLGYAGLGTAELRRGVQTLGRALRSIQEE